MLLPKNIVLALAFLALVTPTSAKTALYGFNSANPYTSEERMLKMDVAPRHILNYREAMRQNINTLSTYGKERNPAFVIIVHEAEDLLDKSHWEYQLEDYQKVRQQKLGVKDDTFLNFKTQMDPHQQGAQHYIKNIDAIALNNLLCDTNSRIGPTALNNLFVLSIDHCQTDAALQQAIISSLEQRIVFYGFIHNQNAFNKIKKQLIIKENPHEIVNITDAKNMQVLIDDSLYKDKATMIEDIANSNYDIIIINPLFHGTDPFSKEEVAAMQLKKIGPKRMIIAQQNISEAKPSDYFWKKDWKIGSPSFLKRKSFVEPQALIAEYWDPAWRAIISKYFKSIVDTGYDGAFLTGVQNYEYFEKQTPLD